MMSEWVQAKKKKGGERPKEKLKENPGKEGKKNMAGRHGG